MQTLKRLSIVSDLFGLSKNFKDIRSVRLYFGSEIHPRPYSSTQATIIDDKTNETAVIQGND